MINRRFVDDYIRKNNQFPANMNDSDLWKLIQMGLNCTDAEAQTFMRFHCNSLAFFTLCKARGYIEFHYDTWCRLLVDTGLMTKRGFIGDNKHNKLDVAQLFGFEDKFNKLVYHYHMNANMLDPDKGYVMKINSRNGPGDHFMACYVENNKLTVSDSSFRGIKQDARLVVPVSEFQWLHEV